MSDGKMLNINVRDVIGLLMVGAFCGAVPLLFWKSVPDANKELIIYMLGQLSGMAALVVGYHYVKQAGQEALEKQRAENTGKAFDAVTATAQSTPGADGATVAADKVAGAAVDEADKIRGGHHEELPPEIEPLRD